MNGRIPKALAVMGFTSLAALVCRLLDAPYVVKLALVFGGSAASVAAMAWALRPKLRMLFHPLDPAWVAHDAPGKARPGWVGNEKRRRRRNRRKGGRW